MERDEAIAIIRKEYLCVDRDCGIEKNCGKCDLVMPSKEPILEAFKIAIKALEQEPCEDATLKDIFCMGCEYKEQQPCGDAISRHDAIFLASELRHDLPDDDDRLAATVMAHNEGILEYQTKLSLLPSINQEPKWDRLYSWLNDMRLGIAPDETVTDIDERNARIAQTDILDEIMEYLASVTPQPKTGHWIFTDHMVYCSECAEGFDRLYLNRCHYCPECGARLLQREEQHHEWV